jgi:hypothetical protein
MASLQTSIAQVKARFPRASIVAAKSPQQIVQHYIVWDNVWQQTHRLGIGKTKLEAWTAAAKTVLAMPNEDPSKPQMVPRA